MQQPQAEPRVRKRVPCRVTVEGRRHSGIVLNVSPRGLYVQTNARARPGTCVEISLTPGAQEEIPLQATVVWRRMVPRELRTDARAGFGVRIQSASEGYYRLLANCLPERERPAAAAAKGAEPSTAAVPLAAHPRSASAAAPRRRFRVRLARRDGPRTRTVAVACETEAEARERALATAGSGWHILDLCAD